jgi:hypothetical protein
MGYIDTRTGAFVSRESRERARETVRLTVASR